MEERLSCFDKRAPVETRDLRELLDIIKQAVKEGKI